MNQRVIVALVYGFGAAAIPLQEALSDGVVSGNEWVGVITAFMVAAWGKYSSSQTVIAPNREAWTPQERAAALAKK